MRGLNTSYPHITTLPQWRLEEILLSRLSTKAERPVKLLSYVQKSDHVVAKLQHGDDENNIEEVHARYLIGSDGAHSSVRKGTPDWKFDGIVFDVPFGLADVTLVGDKVPDLRYMSFIASKKGGFGIIPMLDKDGENIIARIVLPLGIPTTSKDKNDNVSYGIHTGAPFSIEEVQAMIQERSGMFEMKAVDPVWITKFGINERKANGFRRRRAFIMGGKVSGLDS